MPTTSAAGPTPNGIDVNPGVWLKASTKLALQGDFSGVCGRNATERGPLSPCEFDLMPSCRAGARRLMNRICRAVAPPARAPNQSSWTAEKPFPIKVLQTTTGSVRGAGARVLTVADRRVPLIYQTNKRARRIILRFDHGEGPHRGGAAAPRDARRGPAISRSSTAAGSATASICCPSRCRSAPAARSPCSASCIASATSPRRRGLVWQEEGAIHVAGRAEHLARRIEDWLRREARREIERRGPRQGRADRQAHRRHHHPRSQEPLGQLLAARPRFPSPGA